MSGPERTTWMNLEISREVELLASSRCSGYNFDIHKSQQEVMRDCWVQGFLDGAIHFREQLDRLLLEEK